MTTLEGIVAGLIVLLSFVGVAVVALARRADRRTPLDPDPRHDEPTDR